MKKEMIYVDVYLSFFGDFIRLCAALNERQRRLLRFADVRMTFENFLAFRSPEDGSEARRMGRVGRSSRVLGIQKHKLGALNLAKIQGLQSHLTGQEPILCKNSFILQYDLFPSRKYA